jgi:ribonuclease P protein component
MLPKGNRVRKTREFERVFSSRLSVYGKFVRISYSPGTTNITRCAVIVSTKISKKAVIRNKIRRRVRKIISDVMPQLTPSTDLVISCLPKSNLALYKDFKADILTSLQKIFKKIL